MPLLNLIRFLSELLELLTVPCYMLCSPLSSPVHFPRWSMDTRMQTFSRALTFSFTSPDRSPGLSQKQSQRTASWLGSLQGDCGSNFSQSQIRALVSAETACSAPICLGNKLEVRSGQRNIIQDGNVNSAHNGQTCKIRRPMILVDPPRRRSAEGRGGSRLCAVGQTRWPHSSVVLQRDV